MRGRREVRDMHWLNADGMVACNPRDREAAHRAEVAAIAKEDIAAVTCGKRRMLTYRDRREARGCGR